jgi:hypothetical protein
MGFLPGDLDSLLGHRGAQRLPDPVTAVAVQHQDEVIEHALELAGGNIDAPGPMGCSGLVKALAFLTIRLFLMP